MICLLTIAGCGTYLLFHSSKNKNESDSDYVINQVRLQVNRIMIYLEQNSEGLHPNSMIQKNLQIMCKDDDVSLIVAQLDGTVMFNSTMLVPNEKIDLKTSLHYDLYHSKAEAGFF
jgi:hypothetical protein